MDEGRGGGDLERASRIVVMRARRSRAALKTSGSQNRDAGRFITSGHPAKLMNIVSDQMMDKKYKYNEHIALEFIFISIHSKLIISYIRQTCVNLDSGQSYWICGISEIILDLKGVRHSTPSGIRMWDAQLWESHSVIRSGVSPVMVRASLNRSGSPFVNRYKASIDDADVAHKDPS